MIDIEKPVYNWLFKSLRAKYGADKISISNEYLRKPAEFPHVEIEVIDQSNSLDHMYGKPGYDTVAIQIDVYTNDVSGKKTRCKGVVSFIDDLMIGQNFVRTAMTPISSNDSTIYRITARYRVETDGSELFRRR